MYYCVVYLIATLTMPHLIEPHYNPPLHVCLLADFCNHTDVPECGEDKITLDKRLFLDECDMFERNCDYKKKYVKVSYEECKHEEQITNKSSTLMMSTISSNLEDNQTIATKNEIKTTKKSTTQPKEATNDTNDTTINVTNKQETLSYSTKVTTTTNKTAKEICTRAHSTTSTIITRSSTLLLTDSNVSGTSTNSQTTDHANTPSPSTSVDTFTTSKETWSTTNKEETTETKESTVVTTLTTITETFVNSVNTEAVSKNKFNSVSPRKPCATYPKHCGRPTSWETTAKGETRDFYRILKARYGDRRKVLRRTTNWLRRMNYFKDLRPDFVYGRHIDS